jgi:hypothetical protein
MASASSWSNSATSSRSIVMLVCSLAATNIKSQPVSYPDSNSIRIQLGHQSGPGLEIRIQAGSNSSQKKEKIEKYQVGRVFVGMKEGFSSSLNVLHKGVLEDMCDGVLTKTNIAPIYSLKRQFHRKFISRCSAGPSAPNLNHVFNVLTSNF